MPACGHTHIFVLMPALFIARWSGSETDIFPTSQSVILNIVHETGRGTIHKREATKVSPPHRMHTLNKLYDTSF